MTGIWNLFGCLLVSLCFAQRMEERERDRDFSANVFSLFIKTSSLSLVYLMSDIRSLAEKWLLSMRPNMAGAHTDGRIKAK